MYFYKSEKYCFRSDPDGLPNSGEMFVDHSKNRRGGHVGHAMVEYQPNKILCFYSNCNDDNPFMKQECDFTGHSARGWTEYKRSCDGGKTWSEGKVLPYSKTLYDLNCGRVSACEKAVAADDGAIVIFNLISDVHEFPMWEPYLFPNTMRSYDGGETWDTPVNICDEPARVFSVIKKDGKIYAMLLKCKGEVFYEYTPLEYCIYVSCDNGKSFELLSVLPFLCDKDSFYGTMGLLDDGSIIAYSYMQDKENYLRYTVSSDGGRSWSAQKLSRFEKQIRNPQMIKFKDAYFMFGRSGIYGAIEEKGHNVLYCSDDGINWDGGRYISLDEVGFTTAFYSNVICVGTGGGERLLYQCSKAYHRSLTNIMHRWIYADCREESKNV